MSSDLTKEDIFRMFAETDRRFNQTFTEIKEAFAETDKEIKSLHELFTGQWGKLIESIVSPSALKLFQQRGMKVTETYRRIESQRNGSISVASSVLRPTSVRLSNMEIDILLTNEKTAIAVSVKTTLKVQDVREHLNDLSEFTTFFPRYKGVKLYGAVAGINIEEAADRFAYRQGLFVLTSSGEGMIKILNDENFRPKDFEKS